MKFTTSYTLPKEAIEIRENVFVHEQGFQEEFDEIDFYAAHIVLYIDNIPAATCRFFESPLLKEYIIGRIAVLKPYRGQNFGSCLLAEAESEIKRAGGILARLHAQCQAIPFYKKQGYSVYGNIELDENCPHVWMQKKLK